VQIAHSRPQQQGRSPFRTLECLVVAQDLGCPAT
jgi:hypothetical protein